MTSARQYVQAPALPAGVWFFLCSLAIEAFFYRKIVFLQTVESRFEHIYKQNYPKIRYYALRYLLDGDLADNVAQDSFLRLWNNRDKVDLDADVLPYLIVVARNLCLNVLRKQGRHKKYVDFQKDSGGLMLAEQSLKEESSAKLYSGEIRRLVDGCLGQMPENVRTTFLLSRDREMKYSEIAEMQHISVKTVESRITEALKNLRCFLKDYLKG